MGLLRNAICGRTGQALNRFYFQNQLLRQGTVDKDALASPFASVIGNVNGISVTSETSVRNNFLVHAAKPKLSGKVLPTTIRNYATAVESSKFAYCRTMGGNLMLQQTPRNLASNVRFYSSAAAPKTQPKEKSYPTIFWHLHEGIEEIVADYVHHEVTRAWVLIFFRLSLIIVAKDVFLSLVF